MEGPIVFQEQFVRDKNPIKGEKRDFTVSDTSKLYTLHIQNGDAQGNNTVSSAVLNLNGTDWVRPNDFKGKGTLEVQKDSILLNANNTMAIDVSGSPGSTMIVTVIEGGQAGTIRRKNGPLNSHPDQAAHSAGNDKNIFDPADPNSLGDLLPAVPGNENTQVPYTAEAIFSVNDSVPPSVATGELLVQVTDPIQQNLQTILDKYKAGFTDLSDLNSPGYFLIKVNMLTVDISHIAEDIQKLNAEINDPTLQIKSVSFANIESARTFAVVFDLLASDLVKSAEFNSLNRTSTPFKTSESNARYLLPAPTAGASVTASAQNLWWLNEQSTNVIEAWNYSMGYNYTNNKPVEVAVIDSGFAGVSDLRNTLKDFKDKILVNKGWQVRLKFNYPLDNPPPPPCSFPCSQVKLSYPIKDPIPFTENLMIAEDTLACESSLTTCNVTTVNNFNNIRRRTNDVINYPQDHGTKVISTIVSWANNGIGLPGVAPYAKVIPIKVGNGDNITNAEALQATMLVKDKSILSDVDVVNISLGKSPSTETQRILSQINAGRNGITFESRFQQVVTDLKNKNVAVVLSAGNGSYESKGNLNTQATDAIIVGALQLPPTGFHSSTPTTLSPPNPASLTRAIFSNTNTQSHGSNWDLPGDDRIDIWAPGNEMAAWGVAPNFTALAGDPRRGTPLLTGNTVQTPSQILSWNGTSAAAPMITGIVALMKGIKEDLSVSEIERILKGNAHINKPLDSNVRTFPFVSPNSICGNQMNASCGNFYTSQLNLRIVDAKASLEETARLYSLGSVAIEQFTGILHRASTASAYKLIPDSDPTTELSLYFGALNSSGYVDNELGIQGEDLATGTFTPIQNFVGDFVRIDGRRIGSLNSLLVHQIKKVPLTAPTGLASGSIAPDSFILRWNSVPGASNYSVFRNGTFVKLVSTTSALVDGLTPSTTYSMTVQAHSSCCNSPLSNVHLVATASPPTPSPTPTPSASCPNPTTTTKATDTSWGWNVQGVGSGSAIEITNPPFSHSSTLSSLGARPIWANTLSSCPAPCIIQLLKNFSLPVGSTVKSATVKIQVADNAEISVNGRTVGSASLSETQTSPKLFTITPSFFGTGGNNILITLLGFNFFQVKPAISAAFEVQVCP